MAIFPTTRSPCPLILPYFSRQLLAGKTKSLISLHCPPEREKKKEKKNSLDTLILFPITDILPSTQMLQGCHEPLHRRPTRTRLSARNPLEMLTPIQPHIMVRRLRCGIALVQY